MSKAIALFSGGLDSTLAVLIMKRLGVEVTAVLFDTDFGCTVSRRSDGRRTAPVSESTGFEVEKYYIGDKFIELVKNPKFGHGKNMNPCIDCKALMLKEAKKLMEERGADFLITGEVLWQRPMSQRRDTLPRIDREAGVEGLVVRPLSAKLLRPTIPEEKGLIDREKLYGMSGRSRKPQIALAKELGLTEYPQPAGGCLLTDPTFSHRLRDLLSRILSPSMREIQLLRVGRHFRTSDGFRIIVGRDERDNENIQKLAEPQDYLLQVAEDHGSPLVLADPGISDESLRLAASLCARYSADRKLPVVTIEISRSGETSLVEVSPAQDADIERARIHRPDSIERDVRVEAKENGP
jgi:tRNA-uridine 2-sulfurtransferase